MCQKTDVNTYPEGGGLIVFEIGNYESYIIQTVLNK